VLHVHRAERADGLVEALRALLSAPLGDPLAPEVVSVPTRGMERWLTQRLSASLGASEGHSDGVCANVEVPSPRRLAGDAVAASSGIDPDEDPWLPERAVWPLLELVGDAFGDRRFGVARHLAELFDRYALHRPEMLAGWKGARSAPAGDGKAGGGAAGGGAAGGADWQAALWRALDERLGVPGPAERGEGACARLREEPSAVDLPARISLFGLTRLPAGHLRVLRALAEARDVHLFLLHPSPALWDGVAAQAAERVVRRRDDPTRTLATNRLLASWAHDSREMQLVLAGGEHEDHHHPVEHGGGSLLARIQADVRADRAPEPGGLDPADRSVQVHACHGRARQVEVLRDAILHELTEDPSLEPRDVIVMCPDIETFAPLIQATFGAADVGEGRPDLRVRLADRSLRQTNPVLSFVARLVELADQRLTASQVLGLADREPVRRRFGLDDRALEQIEAWVAASGTRWGLDAAHREPFRLGGEAAGTWRKGLERVLVGVTMTEERRRLFGGVLPLDDVAGDGIVLAGKLAELVDRLGRAVDALQGPQPIGAWTEAIAEAADALTATSPRDAWQRLQLQRVLDDVAAESADAETPLTLPEVRALLAERLQGRPTRANFRTGHLTFCTLMPMRSVPHRVVCLLGLDDGVFPRKAPRDGDDLMIAEPHVGDRDSRTEDRQLLLDALMAAGERLIVTYTGNDERTNARKPPAVPVGELLDVVERTAPGAREHVEVRHPLQPFDPRNFESRDPWSFDAVALEGARALSGDREPPPAFLPDPLPAPRDEVVELDALVRFVQDPARAFLYRRLGIWVGDFEDDPSDALPVELDGLARWGLGQRMLDARLEGSDPQAAYRAEIARGLLPPGLLAKPVVQEAHDVVAAIMAEVPAAGEPPVSVDTRTVLERGRPFGGTVRDVVGDTLRVVTFSRVGPKHRLAAWVRLLALCAAHPGRRFEAVIVGRAAYDAPPHETVSVVRILPPADAAALLGDVVALYDRGMRAPVLVGCKTPAAYAEAAHAGRDGGAAAAREWESAFKREGEDVAREHQVVLGGVLRFEELTAALPGFADEARALWESLLEHEQR
jgi:exodeoxyribonuclease V gamma subunit